MHLLYRWPRVLSVWFILAGCASAQVRLAEHCEVRFSTRAEGIAAITADDTFTRSLSKFDLQARLRTDGAATLDDWKKFVAREVLEWDDADRARLTAALESVRDRLARVKVPLPQEIYLVVTSGREEANAAYCRGKYIILPTVVVRRDKGAIESLLIHELFHVVSNQHPELRESLYGILGFSKTAEIAIHPSLSDRRITNPDAPTIDCVMEIKNGDTTLFAAPVLYASGPFDPKREANFFAYLEFKLMVVEREGKGWKAADKDGKAVVLDPKNTPPFLEKIGKNTGYIVHPEEILADNFGHLVLEREKLPTPRIVEDLRGVLAR